jgi:DNA-binding Lrp family transcriptional regulator
MPPRISEERIGLIRFLYGVRRVGPGVIADLVGVSESTVREHTRDLPRQRLKRVGPERSARIRELRGLRLSQRKIAAEVGVSVSTVRRHVRADTGPGP